MKVLWACMWLVTAPAAAAQDLDDLLGDLDELVPVQDDGPADGGDDELFDDGLDALLGGVAADAPERARRAAAALGRVPRVGGVAPEPLCRSRGGAPSR